MAASTISRRQQVFTGVAAVLILALAFWLLLGRSPSSPGRVEVGLGTAVDTDAGIITVRSLGPVESGTTGAPAPASGHGVEAISFRACRATHAGALVDLSLFSVRTSDGSALPAAGSSLSDASASCTDGLVFVQVPDAATPTDVEYAAAPLAVWRLAAA